MILSYEAVVLLAGFAAAAAVAAAAVADGAASAADAARSLADARSAGLAAGRLAAIDVQHGANRTYATIAAAPGSGPAVLAGVWDAAGSPVRCEAAGAGGAGSGISGLAVSSPRTLVCDARGGEFVVAARGGHALRVGAAP